MNRENVLPLNVAVVGLGFMGATHARAWMDVPEARLAAVMSSNERKLSGDLTSVGGNLGGLLNKAKSLGPMLNTILGLIGGVGGGQLLGGTFTNVLGNATALYEYESGTWGPPEAARLLENGAKWFNPEQDWACD